MLRRSPGSIDLAIVAQLSADSSWFADGTCRNYRATIKLELRDSRHYTEWKFEKIEFDGFYAHECRLKEAKARYDQFFNRKTGKPRPFFQTRGAERVLQQARRQCNVVRNNPPTKLTWESLIKFD